MKQFAIIFCLISCLLDGKAQDTNYYTPEQYLGMLPKPVFKPGNKLPRLGTWGWPFSFNLNVEIASNWDYALPFQNYTSLFNLTNTLKNTNSTEYKCLQLARAQPTKFPLQVTLDRLYPNSFSTTITNFIPAGLWVTNAAGQYVDDATNTWTSFANHTAVWSPEGSDAGWTAIANFLAAPLRVLVASNASIAVIVNGGEWGLGVSGYDSKAWKFDVRATNAMATNGLSSWNAYVSQRKAWQEKHVTDAVRSAAPNHGVYSYYKTSYEQTRFYRSGYTNWLDIWASWGWSSIYMNAVQDFPSPENYYQTGWTNVDGQPWNNGIDLLSAQLNSTGFNYVNGITNLCYGWVCGGWDNNNRQNPNRFSDEGASVMTNYMGFLKCLYTAGMIGGVAGYFTYPTNTTPSIFGVNGFSGSFPTNIVPNWISQIVALSRVHALFSYQDSFLSNSRLLAGDGNNYWSLDQPSYEFTNNLGLRWIRTLARQATTGDTNRWLICSWATTGSIPNVSDTNVTVNIPSLGSVNLIARSSGAVYLATPTTLILQDTNGVLPTEWMAGIPNIPDPPARLRVSPAGALQ